MMISSRAHTNAIIEKIEEDKEWVKIGDKDCDEAKNIKACSKVSVDGEKTKDGRR